MENMINGYVESCAKVRSRIAELTQQRNFLKQQGDMDKIEELDLERRIKLLYSEYGQMQEVLFALRSYARRREQSAQT
ncbi:MAG: hypothetical protein K6G82_01435 [Ruminococcus sp.]|nr:hypothetical protein [Ruminococcus sp.]